MDGSVCFRLASRALIVGLAIGGVAMAHAADLLGAYVGAAVGQGRIETGDILSPPPEHLPLGEFDAHHTAYQLMLGVRPISLIGAEIDYIDFGHPREALSAPVTGLGPTADVRMKGGAAFGVLYLPVPVVDVYAKVGLARMQTTTNIEAYLIGVNTCVIGKPTCGLVGEQERRTDTGFAAGAGAQFRLGSWALRAEYERLNAAGGASSLTSIGVTWTFF